MHILGFYNTHVGYSFWVLIPEHILSKYDVGYINPVSICLGIRWDPSGLYSGSYWGEMRLS